MSSTKNEEMFKEVVIKKFPYLSYSSNLIEYFVILGYDNLMINKKIIPAIKSIPLDNDEYVDIYNERTSIFKRYTIKQNPTLLSAVSSNYEKSMLDNELLINLTFPAKAVAYYNSLMNVMQYEPNQENITFFINGDAFEEKTKIPFHGYSFIFYESYSDSFDKVFYIPKSFTIVSQFPLFNLFHTLCKDILKLTKENTMEIPLEILIYNLVNFTPSPINISFHLNAFPSLDLSSYTKANEYQQSLMKQSTFSKGTNVQYTTIQKSIVNNVCGYPILDFNVSEIFNILPISMIIEVFIYNLLECEMVFFSSNLEMLNIVMYLFSILCYPCTDSMYLWHIVSVSKEELTDSTTANRFIGKPFSSMIGINCVYDTSIETCDLYHTHFIVDLDRKEINLRYDPSEYNEIELKHEIDQYKILMSFMEKVLDKKTKMKVSFLKLSLISLFTRLEKLAKRIPNVNTTALKDSSKASFFGNERSEEYVNNNKAFQEIFFNFMLDLLREYFSYISLESANAVEMNVNISDNNTLMNSKSFISKSQLIQTSISFGDESGSAAVYDIQEDSDKYTVHLKNNNNLYYVQYKETMENYNQSETIFNHMFFNTQKYIHFMKEFALKYECFDIYKVYLLFSEEFVALKNKIANENDTNMNYLEILDLFYSENNSISNTNNKDQINITSSHNINFSEFYVYYDKNLKMFYADELKKHHNIILTMSKVFNKRKTTYKYKSLILDSNLLLNYGYFLSNIPEEELIQIFPSIILKQQNKIIDVDSNAISSSLEKHLIKLKYISHSDLNVSSAFCIISLFMQCVHSENEMQMMLNVLFNKCKYCYRKYVTFIIKGLYKLCNDKIKQKRNVHQELIYYSMLMDSLQEKKYRPNEELLLLIEHFSKFKHNLKIDEHDEKNENIQSEQNNQNQYSFELSQNICYDCNYEINKEACIKLVNDSDFDENFEINCGLCNKAITPLIHFHNVHTKEEFHSNIYTPYKINNEISKMVSKNLNNNLSKRDYDFIQNAIINLIVYSNEKDEEIHFVNSILFKCLSSLNKIQQSHLKKSI